MISFKSVKKVYSNSPDLKNKYAAINYVSFCAGPGEVVGIIGENGSGKTTLMKIAANIIQPDKGHVLIDDEPFSEKAYEKLSFVSEEGSYFPFLTPKEHEEFFKVHFKNFDKTRYNKLLDYFDLPVNKKVRSFSKDLKSKFEVVCGFCKGAKYILLDEPFLGTDAATRSDFLKLMIGGMNDDDIIIIATHFIDEIENFLTRALILKKGEIINDINIEKMKEDRGTLALEIKKTIDSKKGDILDILD